MTDLLSLVVTVRPLTETLAPAHLGRAVNALFLRWIDGVDPELAKRWHDEAGIKPYTCSSLIGAKRTGANVRRFTPEQVLWFRLTTFEPSLTAALLQVAEQLPPDAELDHIPFHVEGATADPAQHPWANRGQFETLAAPYLLAREAPPRRLRMRFYTPVAFRKEQRPLPLPLPELVFGSLADRWNAFSPIALSDEMRRYCETGVALNAFRLRSRALPVKDGGLHIGAVGEAGYSALRYDRYWMSLLGLLADFAFYAGVGRGVTNGMGQARRQA